ncbi:hypothetical protein [Jonesia quinghaiensis]|uniref:hypothetical protein n=1 Tax=Jonesia quinghaiensis TaxID=262806 RepID=UPI000490A240|nr:hypothetical protein [Jonesia quinghaiensis]
MTHSLNHHVGSGIRGLKPTPRIGLNAQVSATLSVSSVIGQLGPLTVIAARPETVHVHIRPHAWPQSPVDAAVTSSQRLLAALIAGETVAPATTDTPLRGFPLHTGEQVLWHGQMLVARYRGRDAFTSQSGGMAVGRPAYVATAGLLSSVVMSSQRGQVAAARARGVRGWRDRERAVVVVTSQRIAVIAVEKVRWLATVAGDDFGPLDDVPAGEWRSFPWASMWDVTADVERLTVVCDIDGDAPLMCAGPGAVILAVHGVHATKGRAALATSLDLAPLMQTFSAFSRP